MANDFQAQLIKEGVLQWNDWRLSNPGIQIDLSGLDLSGLVLRNINLEGANLTSVNLKKTDLTNSRLKGAKIISSILNDAILRGAILVDAILTDSYFENADLSASHLTGAYCKKAKFINANLQGASLIEVNLTRANLTKSNLRGANLRGANLLKSIFCDADLTNANLENAVLVETNLDRSILTNCKIYGLSAWALEGIPKDQSRLVITPKDKSGEITVDNLDMAQFIFLLLNNKKIRSLIDTVTSKVVLILGRFTPERLEILDSIRSELNKYNYVPVLFDFEKSQNLPLLETVITLAGMSRFIIADITSAQMVREELRTIVEKYPSKPIQPLLLQSEKTYSTFSEIYSNFKSVLSIFYYDNKEDLIYNIDNDIIKPAERWLENRDNSQNKNYKTEREVDLENQVKVLQQALIIRANNSE